MKKQILCQLHSDSLKLIQEIKCIFLFSLNAECVVSYVIFASIRRTKARVTSLLPFLNEPPHDKTNKMICASSEDSDQPGHPRSLIRVFAVRLKKTWAQIKRFLI